MDDYVILDLITCTEAGAIAAARLNGKGDRHGADDAAVQAMRHAFRSVPISGRVVIGEGERDEAPMLFIGEEVGSGGIAVDIAVDPLEGTNLCARNDPGALSVLAAAPAGSLLHAPDVYMDKIAVGPRCKGKVDLDWPVERNLNAVAHALGKGVKDVNVLIMDRERNEKYISAARRLGCSVTLIRDGDIAGGILPAIPDSGVDILLGIGAAPEGVIAAAALRCLGGDFQGRLWSEDEKQKARARDEMGIADFGRKYMLYDLVQEDAAFIATGVTDGQILRGVRHEDGKTVTHTLVLSKGRMRFIETRA